MPVYALDDHIPIRPEDGRCYIAETAAVVGRVRIGIDVSIWFGAVLRGDNEPIEIGDRTNIQDNCVLHTDPGCPLTIGSGCTIGHTAILHGCTIGDNSMVGMGAIVMNGAKVGSNCLVGAGALVSEGSTFPDGSLIVGTPARVIRPVDDKFLKLFALSAEVYAERGKRYRTTLRRLD